jgi:hypothetical protein
MTDAPEDPPWVTNPNYFPSDDFTKPLGEWLWAFGWLDAQLELVLFSLLGIDNLNQAQVVISFISTFEGRRDLFSQLANLRVPTKPVESLVEVGKQRNTIIHGRYSGFNWPQPSLAIVRTAPRKQLYG